MHLTRLVTFGIAAGILVLGPIGHPLLVTAAERHAAYDNTSARTTGGISVAGNPVVANAPGGKTSRATSETKIPLDEGVIEHLGPAGLKTYRWNFSRVGDADFDGWPDHFTRHIGPGFPEYVHIAIVARDQQLETQVLSLDTALMLRWPTLRRLTRGWPFADQLPPLPPSLADVLIDRCLEMKLDGGQARVLSPRLPTSPRFQYRFSVEVQTRDLVHDSVYAQVIFFDESGQEIQRRSTPKVTQAPGWQTLWIDALVPPRRAHSMCVSMEVMGGEDGLQDIRGVIRFDNITFRQFPQMKVTTEKPFGVYRRGERVHTTTRLLGLPGEDTRVGLKLLDHNERELRTESKQLYAQEIASAGAANKNPAPTPDQMDSVHSQNTPDPFDHSVALDWTIENLEPGFYTLSARMENDRGASLANRSNFVVIDRLTEDPREWSPTTVADTSAEEFQEKSMSIFSQPQTEMDPLPFGWTLPRDFMDRSRHDQVSSRALARWLRNIGVGWVKIPVWYAPEDTASADAAAKFAFRLADFGIQPVGLLDQPRADQAKEYRLPEHSHPGAAAYLHDPRVWRKQLDTIMNRMTFRLRLWQIGEDDDYSFQSRPQLDQKLSEIAIGLQGFGQPLELVIPWPWLDRSPKVSGESWKGMIRHSDQTLTAKELNAMLTRQSQTQPKGRRGDTWITLDPLSNRRYQREARIRDLVLRMATTRGHRVEVAFARHPMSPEATLVTAQRQPEELLLPWRTTSLLLGHTHLLGSLRLRNRSENLVFRSTHSSVLLIWGNRPRTERLFLGDAVYQIDVWGRRSELPTEQIDGRTVHVVEVGRLPKFIVGIDPALAEFRMSVDLDRKRIDSLLGREQLIGVQYQNPIGQALMGKISIHAPPAWTLMPLEQDWDLNSREKGQTDFSVVLGNNATVGQFEVPIDIEFATSPPTNIRVYRELEIGPDGFDLVVSTKMFGDWLRVKIEITNHTRRPANFDCLLFSGPDRQYERRVLVIGPGETVQRNIDLSQGRKLLSQRLLLRAIEQEGDRVINHTFPATP